MLLCASLQAYTFNQAGIKSKDCDNNTPLYVKKEGFRKFRLHAFGPVRGRADSPPERVLILTSGIPCQEAYVLPVRVCPHRHAPSSTWLQGL